MVSQGKPSGLMATIALADTMGPFEPRTCGRPGAIQCRARELPPTPDARFPAGVNQAETLREFSARALSTIDRLAAAGTHRRIALVTHGGVLECAYRSATGMALQSARDFDILNASVNRLQWTPTGMQVISWGDVAHLQSDPPAAGALDELRD